MRVLVVSSVVGKSPSEVLYSFVFDEVYRIARCGIKAHVARSKREGDICSYGICFHDMIESRLKLFVCGVNTLVYYPFSTLFGRPTPSIYFELAYGSRIVRLLKMLKPDILHAHFAYPEGWCSYIALRNTNLKIPFVVTLHGYDILTEPRVGYGIRLNKRYDILVRRVLNEADAVIVASRAVYEEARKLVKSEEKIHLIPNSVDIQRFNPLIDGSKIRRLYNAEDKYIVFTLRHHEPKYGIAYLILAAKIVLKHRKDVVFIIGGDGSLRRFHMALAERLGIKDYVFFPGRIPQDEAPFYYAASDIVVVPSLQEAWGLVATEAMACGKPVIASRVGGLPDQVIDSYNGFLVPSRDPKTLADRILYLLDNPSEMKRMGLNSRRLAEERFDIEKRIHRILKLYRELLVVSERR